MRNLDDSVFGTCIREKAEHLSTELKQATVSQQCLPPPPPNGRRADDKSLSNDTSFYSPTFVFHLDFKRGEGQGSTKREGGRTRREEGTYPQDSHVIEGESSEVKRKRT